MYIERSIRGARDPHGSFAHSHAALGMLVIHYGSFAHSHAALDQQYQISYLRKAKVHLTRRRDESRSEARPSRKTIAWRYMRY